MTSPRYNPPDEYRFRPPLFSREEWRRIVETFMLSQRHAEVAGCVIQNKSDKEIAKLLGIELPTVRTHLKECLRKMNTAGRVGLFYRVVEKFRELYG